MPEEMTTTELKTCAHLLRQACETAPTNETQAFRIAIAVQFEQQHLPTDDSQLMAGATLIYQSSRRAGNEQERDSRFSLAIKLAIAYGDRNATVVVEDSVIGV